MDFEGRQHFPDLTAEVSVHFSKYPTLGTAERTGVVLLDSRTYRIRVPVYHSVPQYMEGLDYIFSIYPVRAVLDDCDMVVNEHVPVIPLSGNVRSFCVLININI